MLFKVIDPYLILSDTFKQLPCETKITYIVICAIANNQTGEFFHKTETIADHANLSVRAVQRSLKRLEEAGVIIFKGKKSRDSRLYVYDFAVKVREFISSSVSRRNDISEKITSATPQSQVNDYPVVMKRLPSRRESHDNKPKTLVNKESASFDSVPNNLNINNMELTTTFGDKFISELIREYGKERVIQNAVAVLKLDGKVENKHAYLRASLRDDYIPISNKQIEQEQAQARRMEYEKKTELERLEWERHVKQVKDEENNPEIQARIKAQLEKLMNIGSMG